MSPKNKLYFGVYNLYFILISLILVIYYQTIFFGFDTTDTDVYLRAIGQLNQKHQLYEIFYSIFTDIVNYNWHPLTVLSLYFDSYISNNNPILFHASNIFLHLINSVLVYKVFSLILKNHQKAFFIALIFAVHPLNVEVVTWIAERKGILAAFFMLLSILYYQKHFQDDIKKHNLILSIVFFTLSLSSKPTTISGILIFILLDIFNEKNFSIKFLLNSTKNKWGYILACVLFGTLTFIAQLDSGALKGASEVDFIYRLESIIHNFFNHISRFIFPVNLTIFYPHEDYSTYQTAYYLLLISFLIYFIYSKKITNNIIIFGLVWFSVFFMPVSGIAASGIQTIADRYSYLPAIGLSIILCELLSKINNQKIYNLSIIILISVLTLLSHVQAKSWANDFTIWKRNYELSEYNQYTSVKLSLALFKQDLNVEAVNVFKTAIENRKDKRHYMYYSIPDLIDYLIETKKYREAKTITKICLKNNMTFLVLYLKLAKIEHKYLKESNKAIKLLKQVIDNSPQFESTYIDLANIYIDINENKQAEATLIDGLLKLPHSKTIKAKLLRLQKK